MEEDYVTRSNYDESNDDTVSCASSTSNLIDDNIDYNVVYALHIFIATVEGQVSVMRGDKLILLDDNNSYWWLVKIVKTSDIGYIPAENIETPFERLARFNKYRNTEVIFIPSSVNEYIHRRKSTNKKVTMATNVSIQSMIVTLDDDSSQITETFQESQGNIDHPFASTTIDPDTTSSSTRLSNHALSIEKLSVLRVFAGNISAKATFYSVLVTENTTAEQLLNLALDRYHLADDQQKQCEGIEYYITAKVIDGDEIALAPQDKPLAIFHSLNTHLTTPMPSLTHIRSKIQLTRIGVSKTNVTDSFGENSVIRFLLHKRIKRINEQDGHLRIKIAYYNTVTKKSSTTTTFSPSRFSQIEKLVSIPGNTVVSELTCLALEKFHIQ
ncbi:uncharacterized protein BX664DRAFT_257877, partial [Halteromyces radiatus]|uniref:uncharacterized protein n=1 Tax=Halteromyces radiatus TaxID=101107 RepID=UPI00221F970D